MSKRRPGVEAAIQLAKSGDVDLWSQVDGNHDDVIAKIGGLSKLQGRIKSLGEDLREGTKKFITKSELLEIVIPWKFAVGKPRHALLGQLRSNSESAVAEATKSGIALSQQISSRDEMDLESKIKTAVEAITELKGVGPATASVILSLVRPDIFCYMYDEVIDCFLPKRTYSLKVYMTCVTSCMELSRQLKDQWMTAKIARTLWVAAREKAMGMGTATNRKRPMPEKKKKTEKVDSTEKPEVVISKRRRRK